MVEQDSFGPTREIAVLRYTFAASDKLQALAGNLLKHGDQYPPFVFGSTRRAFVDQSYRNKNEDQLQKDQHVFKTALIHPLLGETMPLPEIINDKTIIRFNPIDQQSFRDLTHPLTLWPQRLPQNPEMEHGYFVAVPTDAMVDDSTQIEIMANYAEQMQQKSALPAFVMKRLGITVSKARIPYENSPIVHNGRR